MATLDELVGKLRVDGRYTASAELLASFSDIDPDKLKYLERICDVFRGIERYYVLEWEDFIGGGGNNPIVVSNKTMNENLAKWIDVITRLKFNQKIEDSLQYSLNLLNSQKGQVEGIIAPDLLQTIVDYEDNEFYIALIKKIIKQAENVIPNEEILSSDVKSYVKNIPKREAIAKGIALLEEIKKYNHFCENEFNLVAPLFEDLSETVKTVNRGYLLHLIGRAASFGLMDYTAAVMESETSTLTKCFMLQQPIPKQLVAMSSNAERFGEFAESFERYVAFIKSIRPNGYSPDELQISYERAYCNNHPTVSFTFYHRDFYEFLLKMRETLSIMHEEELDSDKDKLIKLMIKNRSRWNYLCFEEFRLVCSLEYDFKSSYPLEDIMDLLCCAYNKKILESEEAKKKIRGTAIAELFYEGTVGKRIHITERAITIEQKRKAFEYVKGGECDCIEDTVECSTINLPGFEVIKKLGEGGSRETYLLKQNSSGILLVGKRLLDEPKGKAGKDQQTRHSRKDIQVREFSEFYYLEDYSPNIVKIFPPVENDDGVWAIEEYVQGKNLEERMCNLDYSQKISVFYRMMSGIEYLHKHNKVSRDIKLDNVLVSDDLKKVKLTDFQFIADEEEIQKGERTSTGSDRYKAPELVRKEVKSANFQTDIYSLCACLYYMLTEETQSLKTINHLPKEQYTEELEKLLDKLRLPYLQNETKDFLRKGLNYDVGERYQGIVEMTSHFKGSIWQSWRVG